MVMYSLVIVVVLIEYFGVEVLMLGGWFFKYFGVVVGVGVV